MLLFFSHEKCTNMNNFGWQSSKCQLILMRAIMYRLVYTFLSNQRTFLRIFLNCLRDTKFLGFLKHTLCIYKLISYLSFRLSSLFSSKKCVFLLPFNSSSYKIFEICDISYLKYVKVRGGVCMIYGNISYYINISPKALRFAN